MEKKFRDTAELKGAGLETADDNRFIRYAWEVLMAF